ncbi:HIT family protein [Cesiribacter andamanensis]|nr:HIT family protein [Cesiribacter andamanensis]
MKCPFCSKTPPYFILESRQFAAIYNLSPILPGHSLIIPKWHVESLFALTDQQLAEFMQLGRDMARLLGEVFRTDAFDWAIQEKEAAGQSVPHLHMHVVPRRIGDLPQPGDWYQALEKSTSGDIDTYHRFRLSEAQLLELTARLRQAAGSPLPSAKQP